MKVFLLPEYISVHKFDITCHAETYVNSKTSSAVGNLEILLYNIIGENYTCNGKRGGVCVYHKNSLSLNALTPTKKQ